MKHTTLALLALGTSACLGVDGEDIANVEQEAGTGCPPFACGAESNSPVIDMYGFHSMKNPAVFPLEANTGGFTLVSYEEKLGYKTDNIRVEGAELKVGPVGKSKHPVGGYLRLKHKTGAEYLIFIKAASDATYWAKNAAGNKTHTYFFKWLTAPGGGALPREEDPRWPNVCSNPSKDNNGEAMGMNGQHVVLFESDLIDANTIEVTGQNPNWFNIGCAGHALAKLHLSGHTEGAMRDTSAIVDPYETKDHHRTTYLKAIAGDYCGKGRPFTVAGMPLNWADIKTYDTGVAGAWMKFANDNGATPNNLEIEARWNETGATCLNVPRVDHNILAVPEGKETYDPMGFASLEDAIAAECKRPDKCVPDDEHDFDKHHIVTANPL